MLRKELFQLRRDRLTFAMLIGALDSSPLVRTIVHAAQNTEYFNVVEVGSEREAERLIARSPMQSMQMTMFFFLPSIWLSGFMFPFRGMPRWAQWIGEALPLTHFLRIVRGVMLKGAGLVDVLPQTWPIGLFIVVVAANGLKRHRQMLD